jgi:hypothetical protein
MDPVSIGASGGVCRPTARRPGGGTDDGEGNRPGLRHSERAVTNVTTRLRARDARTTTTGSDGTDSGSTAGLLRGIFTCNRLFETTRELYR